MIFCSEYTTRTRSYSLGRHRTRIDNSMAETRETCRVASIQGREEVSWCETRHEELYRSLQRDKKPFSLSSGRLLTLAEVLALGA